MSQINSTYFMKGLTAVPNLQGAVLESLDSYIEDYEDIYFNKVLGVTLKREYLSGLEEVTPAEKWTKLRDGDVFKYNGITYEWRGFLNTMKKSPIAYYVFFHYLQQKEYKYTGVNTAKSKAENADRTSPDQILVQVYNRMVEQNKILQMYLLLNTSDYSSYAPGNELTEEIIIYGI